ncbi:MAG TPA: hypothetical protein VJR27_03300 [Candidatus Saccharimonadales bacterium]|nr:hypothetical protein [Candidatus Saccharimonadales bacterium]
MNSPEFDARIEGLGENLVAKRDFLGRKLAHEAMEEWGMLGAIDETGEAALCSLMATPAVSGMVLEMGGTTEPIDIESEVLRLVGLVPDQLKPTVERLSHAMIPRGIEFRRNELVRRSEKALAWLEEFRFLQSSTDPT